MQPKDNKHILASCYYSGTLPGDNTEKIPIHQLFAKQKTDVPKVRKMAAGGPGSIAALPVEIRGQVLKG